MATDDEYLKETAEPGTFTPFREVNVEILSFTDLGITVAINNEYVGLAYSAEIYSDYRVGQKLKAYIKCIREDGKIDVSFQPNHAMHVQLTTKRILTHLKAVGGRSSFNDKSSPEEIRNQFQASKKVFKQAIGNLYKQGRIEITAEGITLVNRSKSN